MAKRELRGTRYYDEHNRALAEFITDGLRYLDWEETRDWYTRFVPEIDTRGRALLGCNDRFFLLTGLLNRRDANHPWIFSRVREVEASPDGHIDLWARYHYKSTIITFAGAIQEVLCDPDIKICIFSVVKPISRAFLNQIKEEFENNEYLQSIYQDVLWQLPKRHAPTWSVDKGIVVKRQTNPKEATIEAHGLIDGQPTSRHYDLHIYDDVVTQDYLSPDAMRKTTERLELADNLGTADGVRKWMPGTRYHFGDSYGVMIERKSLKPRIHAATHDGTLKGRPVFMTMDQWDKVKRDQRSTVSAQMLLNPVAGNEAIFRAEWLKTYEVRPNLLNVYIMCDPSKGRKATSDRTAIAAVGIDPGWNKYLLDGFCHRMGLAERYERITFLRNKWMRMKGVQHVGVGYEQYGMLTDLEVMEEWMRRDDNYFLIEELNTPQTGGTSKNDRIERLEPDIRNSHFHLPAVAWNPDVPGGFENLCYWRPWTKEDQDKAEEKGDRGYSIGHILYWGLEGLTKLQKRVDRSRIVTALKRLSNDREIYDLTRVFIDQMRLVPFSPYDDLIDAISRIYDMKPIAPIKYEHDATDALKGDDLAGDYLSGTELGMHGGGLDDDWVPFDESRYN
jgi:hypothetical protein